MTDTIPGYRVAVEVFIPANPDEPRQMASAAALLDNLGEQLQELGLRGAAVSYRFIARHRISSPPAAPVPAVPAPTLEPATQAAAEPAEAAAASIEYQAARADGAPSGGPQAGEATPEPDGAPAAQDGRPAAGHGTHRREPQQAPEVSGSGGQPCAHPIAGEHPEHGRICVVCKVPLPAGETA